MAESVSPPGCPTPPAVGHRRVALPHGETLEVRPASHGDVDGLVALYASLSDEDLYRRFFGGFHPSADFLEGWIASTEEDGMDLVAVIADGGERIVGECGYALLPDGDGEFAITIAPDWRGWLGPYLLDALMEVAASKGVPNLQADVMLENRGMLALARGRGCANLDHADWSSVRLTISTTGPVPSWPGAHDVPRVLVEVPGGRWQKADDVRSAGARVVECAGPGDGTRCPAIAGRPCPLAAEADVIVVASRLGQPTAAALREAHRRLHPNATLAGDDTDVAAIIRARSVARGDREHDERAPTGT